jgi:hypothetical protein
MRLDEDLCRYHQTGVEFADHLKGERALAAENFGNSGAAADIWLQVPAGKAPDSPWYRE